jgi:predicted AAA+ superfamily ATPase
LKLRTLQEYFEVMIYLDIVERYQVKNVVVLKEFIKQIVQSATKEYSINKI